MKANTTRHGRHYFLDLGRYLRIYSEHLGDYMRRWILQWPGGTLRLHHIMRSDVGRDLHDHPWDFWSLLLTGGYTEVRPARFNPHTKQTEPERAIYWPRFSVVRRQAEDLHRLVLRVPVWTVVWTGPKRRTWGFRTRRGWVPWRSYHRPSEPWHAKNASRNEP